MQNKIEIISKEKKELEENIKTIISQKNSINSEYCKSVDIIKMYKESKKYENNLKTMERIKELEKSLENSNESFDIVISIYTNKFRNNEKNGRRCL